MCASGLSRACAGLLLLFFSLVEARGVLAHNLGIECKLRGDRVEVEAYYDDDTAAGDARVTVQDSASQTVAQGRTDTQGRWQFPAPAPGRYRVVVDAGAGHQARVTIAIPAPNALPADTTGVPGNVEPVNSGKSGHPEPAVVLSEGPVRAEFTRTPWLPAAIGLGIIGLLGLVCWLTRKFAGARPA